MSCSTNILEMFYTSETELPEISLEIRSFLPAMRFNACTKLVRFSYNILSEGQISVGQFFLVPQDGFSLRQNNRGVYFNDV